MTPIRRPIFGGEQQDELAKVAEGHDVSKLHRLHSRILPRTQDRRHATVSFILDRHESADAHPAERDA